jgi:phage terminase small subunit
LNRGEAREEQLRKLTAKQQRFIEEYLLDLNAAQAAIRAGYSPRIARQQGSANLKKPHIAAAVETAMLERGERTRVSADKVVTELAKLGFSDWRELGVWGADSMTLTASSEITDEAAACVKDVHMTREVRHDRNGDLIETVHIKLQLHDKKGALELLGRHLGLFKDNLNITNDRPFEIKVRGLGITPLHTRRQRSFAESRRA